MTKLSLERDFTRGLAKKTFLLGLVVTALSSLTGNPDFVGSVFIGVLVSTFNMLAVGWIGRKLLASGHKGRSGAGFWLVSLPVKLLILLALTFYIIVVVEADVIGFLLGFCVFFVAIGWQTKQFYPMLKEPGDEESHTDSDVDSQQRRD